MRGLANGEAAAQLLGPVLRYALHRDTAEGLAVEQIQGAACRAAVRARLFQYRLKDRLELTGRGVDDLQYLGRRGLLLQRLAQLGQQPRILDRNHRLVGEGAHQFDLPIRERLDPKAVKCDDADWLALAQERHPKYGASPGRK